MVRGDSCVYENQHESFGSSRQPDPVYNTSRTTELRPALPRQSEPFSPISISSTPPSIGSYARSQLDHTSSWWRDNTADITYSSNQLASNDKIQKLRMRIRELEGTISRFSNDAARQKAAQTPKSIQPSTKAHDKAASPLLDSLNCSPETEAAGLIRHMPYKTRLYGGSHWLIGTAPVCFSRAIICFK